MAPPSSTAGTSQHIIDGFPKRVFRIPYMVWPSVGILSLGLYYYLPRAFPTSDYTYINKEVDMVRLKLGLPPLGDPISLKRFFRELKESGDQFYADIKLLFNTLYKRSK